MCDNSDAAAAVHDWMHMDNINEYGRYVARDEYVCDLSLFEQCVFLDLIDHSEM